MLLTLTKKNVELGIDCSSEQISVSYNIVMPTDKPYTMCCLPKYTQL